MGMLATVRNLFNENSTKVIDPNDKAAVSHWLSQRLASHLGDDIANIDPNKSFEQYGLDSMFAVKITGELEKIVELRLSPALLFENTCINDVATVITNTTTAT